MISKSHKFIFVHIPKCGGSTVIRHFQKFWKVTTEHMFMSEIDKMVDDLDSYYKFTVIRNPWERMASLWSYYQKPDLNRIRKEFKDEYNIDSFKNLIYMLPTLKSEYKNKTTFASMNEYLGDYEYDNIIPLGNLSKELKDLSEVLVNSKKRVQIINSSTKTDEIMLEYTPKMIDIVSQVYSDDIERFKFKFNDKSNS